MRIAIVGLGGVGGYLLANISKTQHTVVGFARGEHLKAVQKNGITVIEDDITYNLKVDAHELKDAQGIFDIVIFCTKSYDLKDACKAMQNHITNKSVIISFSNGVNNADILREVAKCSVLEGCIYILSHIESYGVIKKKGGVFVSVFGGEKSSCELLASVFEDASLRYKRADDIKKALWKKYIFISAFASLTSYYDKSIGYIYENHFDETKNVLLEIASLAKAKGIDINKEVQKSLDTASKLPYDSSTSMHLDFKNGKKTEVDTICGYVVKEAKKENIDVACMERIYKKLILM